MKSLFFHNPILFRFFPDALNSIVITCQILKLLDGHRISRDNIQNVVGNQFVSPVMPAVIEYIIEYKIIS